LILVGATGSAWQGSVRSVALVVRQTTPDGYWLIAAFAWGWRKTAAFDSLSCEMLGDASGNGYMVTCAILVAA